VLVVDDVDSIALVLSTLLSREGYQVQIAGDGRQALDMVKRWTPDLILLDLEMPFMDGYEVCRRLKSDAQTRLIPIVILTGQGSFQNKLEAWDLGADDFLTKPFQSVEVLTRCRSLLRIKRLIEERDSAEAVVFALARAVEAKSAFTHGHSERVRNHALALARVIGITPEEQEILHKGALLHDVGKISLPDSILNKAGPLTEEEIAIVRTHPEQGARIIEPLHSVRNAMPLIRSHHERLDGTGYPDRLHGEEIPLLVRILSVADVFDAMSSDRPYRPAMPLKMALEKLREDAAGGGLDPGLVEVFCELMSERRESRNINDQILVEVVHGNA
jgi:putative two-component system response regulator